MNEFLKSREQVNQSTQWLHQNGYRSHPLQCKDWELRTITEAIGDGDLLDMGADGSFCLHNAINKNIKGRKIGIDLIEVTGDNKAEGAEYIVGDLMKCPFEDNSFDTIVSASVIEHSVDLSVFSKEVSRLLRPGGQLIVSFDYNPVKVDTSKTKLYALDWNILDRNDVNTLRDEMMDNGMELTSHIDWTTEGMVINKFYCAPADVEYTFGILNFKKVN